MPKEMINFTLDRKGNEPWGFVIVGGKDQVSALVLTSILILTFIWIWILDMDVDVWKDMEKYPCHYLML